VFGFIRDDGNIIKGEEEGRIGDSFDFLNIKGFCESPILPSS
jgi:hypothetical protein